MAAMRRPQAGFTLLEAVVSTLIVGVALLLANGLLLASRDSLALSSQRALDPLPDLALAQLRADLRLASGAVGGEPLWSREALRLRDHPAGELLFVLDGGRLIRRLRPAGGEVEERVLLDGVVTWRWRRPLPGASLVEAEIGYRRRARLRPGRRGDGEILPVLREERRRLAVHPRGGGGPGW